MNREMESGRGGFPPGQHRAGERLVALVVGDGHEDWMLADEVFEAAGCTVRRADHAGDAIRRCSETNPALAFLPLTLDGKSTTNLLRQCLANHPTPVVVVVASNDQINSAAEAMRIGAYDCLFKPYSHTRLARTIDGAIKQVRQLRLVDRPVIRRPRPPASASGSHPAQGSRAMPHPAGEANAPADRSVPRLSRQGFIASSDQMREVLAQATAVAGSDAPVFFTGEVGTGKSVLARIVHELSPRAAGPFVTVDCATLTADTLHSEFAGPDGALTRAAGGTLLLDEIGDLGPEVQPMLLRLIERARADGVDGGEVRFIAATARDPRVDMGDGRMRPDLFYRLHVAPIALPPLRARDGDLPLIARAKLAAFSEAEGRGFVGFSDTAMKLLQAYRWPGNLRELINVLWTAVLMNEGPLVTPDLLPPEIQGTAPSGDFGAQLGSARHVPPSALNPTRSDILGRLVGRTLAEIEQAAIEATIRAEDGSVPRAARVLDVAPSTLYRKRESWSKQAKS